MIDEDLAARARAIAARRMGRTGTLTAPKPPSTWHSCWECGTEVRASEALEIPGVPGKFACSPACARDAAQDHAERHTWTHKAQDVADTARAAEMAERVAIRREAGRGLCKRCSTPLPPPTGNRGRPPVYCGDACAMWAKKDQDIARRGHERVRDVTDPDSIDADEIPGSGVIRVSLDRRGRIRGVAMDRSELAALTGAADGFDATYTWSDDELRRKRERAEVEAGIDSTENYEGTTRASGAAGTATGK